MLFCMEAGKQLQSSIALFMILALSSVLFVCNLDCQGQKYSQGLLLSNKQQCTVSELLVSWLPPPL